jgi:hypothetical protein
MLTRVMPKKKRNNLPPCGRHGICLQQTYLQVTLANKSAVPPSALLACEYKISFISLLPLVAAVSKPGINAKSGTPLINR